MMHWNRQGESIGVSLVEPLTGVMRVVFPNVQVPATSAAL